MTESSSCFAWTSVGQQQTRWARVKWNTIITSSWIFSEIFQPVSETFERVNSEISSRKSSKFSYSLSALQLFIGIFFVFFLSLLLSDHFIAMANLFLNFSETDERQLSYQLAAKFCNLFESPNLLFHEVSFSHWRIFFFRFFFVFETFYNFQWLFARFSINFWHFRLILSVSGGFMKNLELISALNCFNLNLQKLWWNSQTRR